MADAVVTVRQQKGKENFLYLFEQEIDRSIYEQLNKLNAKYTCKILVARLKDQNGNIKFLRWIRKSITVRKTNL